MLANEWDDLPLSDWGVPAWDTDIDDLNLDLSGVPLSKTDIENIAESFGVTFMFPTSERETVEGYMDKIGKESLTKKIIQLCQDAEAK